MLDVRERATPGPTRCPYCHDSFAAGERTWLCPLCATEHHLECARLNGGCTLVGCSGTVRTRGTPEEPSAEPLALRIVAVALMAVLFAAVIGGALLLLHVPKDRPSPPAKVVSGTDEIAPPSEPVKLPVGELAPARPEKPRPELIARAPWTLVARAASTSRVRQLASSGDRVVLAREKSITSFDASGRIVRTIASENLGAIALLPDGRGALAVASSKLLHYDLETGAVLRSRDHVYSSELVASPDSSRVLLLSYFGESQLVDVADLDSVPITLRRESVSSRVALAPDGRHVVLVGSQLEAWDLTSGQRASWSFPPLRPHDLSPVAIFPDSRRVLANDGDRLVTWDVVEGKPLADVGPRASSCALSADGRVAIVAHSGWRTQIHDLAARTSRPLAGWIEGFSSSDDAAVAIAADGHTAYTFGARGALAWDVATGRPLAVIADHPRAVTALAGAPGRGLFVARADGSIALVDANGVATETIHPLGRHRTRVTSLALSSDRMHAVSASEDGSVRTWNVRTGELEETVATVSPPRAVALSDRGVLVADAEGVRLHEKGSSPGRLVAQASGGAIAVVRLADDATAALSGDGALIVVRANERKVLGVPRARALTATADGATLAVGSGDGTLMTFDARTGKPDRWIRDAHGGAVTALAFHPDGRHVASIGADRRVRLWSIATGEKLFDLGDDQRIDAPLSLAFSPEGDRLLVGTAAGSVLVIDLRKPD